jgi:hypothetical protein
VKEKRKGPIGRAAGIAEGLAATVRRMQREREPRVLVYDETGYARLVQPDGRGYERLLETAEQMVALVDEAEAKAKPRRAAAEAGTAEEAAKAKPRRAKAGARAKAGPAGKAGAKPRRATRDAAGGAGRGKTAAKSRARAKAPGDGAAKPRRTRRAPRKDDA